MLDVGQCIEQHSRNIQKPQQQEQGTALPDPCSPSLASVSTVGSSSPSPPSTAGTCAVLSWACGQGGGGRSAASAGVLSDELFIKFGCMVQRHTCLSPAASIPCWSSACTCACRPCPRFPCAPAAHLQLRVLHRLLELAAQLAHHLLVLQTEWNKYAGECFREGRPPLAANEQIMVAVTRCCRAHPRESASTTAATCKLVLPPTIVSSPPHLHVLHHCPLPVLLNVLHHLFQLRILQRGASRYTQRSPPRSAPHNNLPPPAGPLPPPLHLSQLTSFISSILALSSAWLSGLENSSIMVSISGSATCTGEGRGAPAAAGWNTWTYSVQQCRPHHAGASSGPRTTQQPLQRQRPWSAPAA